jgi:lipopolysaccharide transport system permease protein
VLKNFLEIVLLYRAVILRTSITEMRQRYAGSALGSIWIIIYPSLFLSIYLFIYLVVFRIRFPGFSSFEYVAYVFSGLVPYLVIMEATTRSALILRENMHLVKNVMVPIEVIPVRLVVVSLLAQAPSFFIMVVIAILSTGLSFKLALLPVAVFMAAIFILGGVLFVSSLGAILNDVSHIVGLMMTALMFLSPIAFMASMLPDHLQYVIYINPISYPLEFIRWTVLGNYQPNWILLGIYPVLMGYFLYRGLKFFSSLKEVLSDNA